jgi:hypothetical protein
MAEKPATSLFVTLVGDEEETGDAWAAGHCRFVP